MTNRRQVMYSVIAALLPIAALSKDQQVKQFRENIGAELQRMYTAYTRQPGVTNDMLTRRELSNLMNDYMRPMLNRRAITRYEIVCDASNNPPSAVESNVVHMQVSWTTPFDVPGNGHIWRAGLPEYVRVIHK